VPLYRLDHRDRVADIADGGQPDQADPAEWPAGSLNHLDGPLRLAVTGC